MMFDAPGSENELSRVITVISIVCYPIVIIIGYALLKKKFFRLNSLTCLAVVTFVVLLALNIFGYFELLWNSIKY